MSADYTVRLEQVFQGPLDLLLHLIREQEVEIHEVQISRVIGGYMAYVSQLETIDLEFAGDFLVMAATLMAIKSRSLLPREDVDLDDELDSEDELIERLLEYRRFKDVSEALLRLEAERERIHPRGWRGEVKEASPEKLFDLSELTVFDLFVEYSRLMRETNADQPHVVHSDPRPLKFYVQRVVDRVKALERTNLHDLVGEIDGPLRETLVGSFCALLELCKLGVITVEQPGRGEDITICLSPRHRVDIDHIVESIGLEEEHRGDREESAPNDAQGVQDGSDPGSENASGGVPARTPAAD